MIEVKGTQTTAAPDGAERFTLKSMSKKSLTPLYFGMLLTGLALYLKGLFPSWAEPETDGPPPAANDDAAGSIRPEQSTASVEEAAEPPASEPQDPAEPSSRSVGQSGSGAEVVDLFPPEPFSLVDSRPFQFKQADVSRDWDPFKTSPVMPAPNNDNPGGSPPKGAAYDRNDVPPGNQTPSEPGPAPGPDSAPGPSPDPGDDDTDGDLEEGDLEEDDGKTGSSNRAPRIAGSVMLLDAVGCATLVIALSDLLRGAHDPDGDPLTVKNVTVSSGTLTATDDGWAFQGSGLGPVTVTYEISDGALSIVQTAHFSVLEQPPIIGSNGDDAILGTLCADEIDGRDGNDMIDGRAGRDTILGGNGDDRIVGGEGDDTLLGGDGHDVIFGGAGHDHISGGAGDDRLFGGEGDDLVFGDAGNDALSGGESDDALFGGGGDDVVEGDSGNDLVSGGDGDDQLRGGIGNDRILGDAGADLVEAGEGNDTVLDGDGEDRVLAGAGDDQVTAALDRADDNYDGEAGTDTLDYSATARGVAIDLEEGSATGAEIGTDKVAGFETALGGSGEDVLTGSERAETLQGGAGDDEIAANAGDDVVQGDNGGDLLSGGAGADRLFGGDGDDVLLDGEGSDLILGGGDDDRVVVALDGEHDIFGGEAGSDTLDLSCAMQELEIDLVNGTAESVEIGQDTISGFENVVGGQGDDRFIVGAECVVLTGGGGANTFEFTPPTPDPEETPRPQVLTEIVDFKQGDLIKMSKYEIFDRVMNELDPQFEAIYGQEVDDGQARIQYRHERADELDRTTIEADLDHDGIFEVTISLHGRHALVMVESTYGNEQG